VENPELFLFAVTIAELPDRHERGTHFDHVFFDRESADQYAANRERSHPSNTVNRLGSGSER